MSTGGLTGLYGVTPDWDDTEQLCRIVEALMDGGLRLLQYRHKTASPALRHEQASRLRRLTSAGGARLVINDDPQLARQLGADGVHLGRDDGSIAAARALLGPAAIIGVSCYNELARALAADAGGADYIAFGAMFDSPTKPAATRAPPSLIGEARRHTALPIACIGGITLEHAPSLRAAGADMLAVITDLFSAPDPAARAAAYQTLLQPRNEP